MFIKYREVRDHCHYTGKCRGAAHICNPRHKKLKETPVVFHKGSVYDYHFIIKELAKEFDGQFKCSGENTEKFINFSVTIKEELDNGKTPTYKLKFIDSFRFMSTSLSSLVNNLSDELYNDKCTDYKPCLEYISAKDDQLIFKCPKCNKNHNKDFNNDSINRIASTYEFCDKDINKFILLFRKGVYPYEYMNTSERFHEVSLPNKEELYSSLDREEITDDD